LDKFAAIHLSQSWLSLIENKLRARHRSPLVLENLKLKTKCSVISKELDTMFGIESTNSDTDGSTYCNKDDVPTAYSLWDVGMQNQPDVTAKI